MARKETENKDTEAEAQMSEETTAVTVPSGSHDVVLGGVGGDTDLSTSSAPYLQIAYGVGSLAADFNQGDLVLGGEHRLVGKGEPLTMIILSAYSYWKEWLTGEQFDAGLKPRSCANREEVIAMGGTHDWNQKDKDGIVQERPTFSQAMDLNLLIRKPKDLLCGVFGDILGDGHEYAPAKWCVDKQAFKRVGPIVLQAQGFSLRQKGLLGGIFEATIEVTPKNTRTQILPKFKLAGYNEDAVIEKIKMLFGKNG